jgi:hypothetical protein
MQARRPISVQGDTAFITLTQGYVAIIDATDVALVDVGNWSAHVNTSKDGTPRNVYARRVMRDIDGSSRSVLLHRFLLGVSGDIQVDHVSGDGLDNRRSNLRLATHTQNTQNATRRKDNASGARGVNWHGQTGKWHATIQADKRRHSLGLFDTVAEAAAAYAAASVRLHGEFGRPT